MLLDLVEETGEILLPCTFVVEVVHIAGTRDFGYGSWETLRPANQSVPSRRTDLICVHNEEIL